MIVFTGPAWETCRQLLWIADHSKAIFVMANENQIAFCLALGILPALHLNSPTVKESKSFWH
jgi:hypothetical protein